MRSNSFGFVLILGLALVALVFIFQWQGGSVAMPSFGSDSRLVVKVGSKTAKFKESDLQVGDTILAINGIEVHSAGEAYKVLEALYQPGLEQLSVSVRRSDDDGKAEVKSVNLSRDRIKTLKLKGSTGKIEVKLKPTPEMLVAAADAGNATAVDQMLDTTEGRAVINKPVDGQTALMAAVSKGNMEVVRVLLEHGADPNKASDDQTTPLIRAAELNNADLVAALMVAGADPGIRNSQLQTASDVAESMGFGDVSDFIENPNPTRFLTSDQKRKIADPLRNMGVLKQSGYRPTDAELSAAIRAYQRQAGLPESGIVTAESYGDLVRYSARALGTKNADQLSAFTKITLARLFARPMKEDWSPVNSTNGYPRCEEENVRFEISADQKVITWKSYRPGVTDGDIAAGAKPTQQANFKVQWANQIDGYDSIMVQPDPKPMNGPTYQLWEIREGTMKITQQAKKGSGQGDVPSAQSDADAAPSGDAPSTDASTAAVDGSGRASFLAACHS